MGDCIYMREYVREWVYLCVCVSMRVCVYAYMYPMRVCVCACLFNIRYMNMCSCMHVKEHVCVRASGAEHAPELV